MKKRIDKQNKIRLFLLLALPALLCGAMLGFLYAVPSLPCPIRHATGLLCPGCGMSRALGEILHLHFIKSVLYNPLAVISAALGIGFYVQGWLVFFDSGKRFMPQNKWFYIILAAVFALYCMIRNIPALSFISIA